MQLTALSLRFAHEPDRVVDRLVDTDRLVVDYLSEEVLDAQGPDRRAALIELSAIDMFCPPLVDAILDVEAGGAEFIDGLIRDSMFIVAVPSRTGWYRFHRLFGELLRLRLRAQDAASEARVLRAAADWCRAEGLLEDANEYDLRAHRWDRVIDSAVSLGRDVYVDRKASAVAAWLERVPDAVRARRPEAALLLALLHGWSGRATIAIDSFRSLLEEDRLTVGERQIALAYLAACVQFAPHAEFFADAARECLDLLERQPDAARPSLLGLTSRPILANVSRISLGRALLFMGDVTGARQTIQRVFDAGGPTFLPYRVHALGTLALAECLSGRLTVANDLAADALALANEFDLLNHPAPADALLAKTLVSIYRGEANAGAFTLVEGTVRAIANQRTQLMWLAHLASLLVDPEGTATEPVGPAPPLVHDASIAMSMHRTRLRGFPRAPSVAPSARWSYVAFEEVAALIELGQPAAARARIAQASANADLTAPACAVELQLLLGWADAVEGRGVESRSHLQAALTEAEPQWLVLPFLRAGPHVARLIDALPGAPDAFHRLVVLLAGSSEAPLRPSPFDKLTPRELELLDYLPSRMTVAEIAARSFVSINTIKTHMGHIYRKLGVSDRNTAITRAIELGLIDPGKVARIRPD